LEGNARIFRSAEFIVISQRESRLRNPFQRRFRDRYFFVPALARDRGAQQERIERRVRARRPTDGLVWYCAVQSSTRQRKRPKKDRDAHRALPRWTPRFSPRDRKRRGSRARNSTISMIPSLYLCLFLSLSLPPSLPPSLSRSRSLPFNGIYRGDRSRRSILRYTFLRRVPQSLVPAHIHISLFSVRVCRYETRSR